MREILVVVDMQNDFIDGALGTGEAVAILPAVKRRIDDFAGEIIFTRDTHGADYAETQEGRRLPVPHCIKGTYGWEIRRELTEGLGEIKVFDKPTFGSAALAEELRREEERLHIDRVILIGLCTDICVISNAMLLKVALPEAEIVVDAACAAGVTPESHKNALMAMRMCQITVEND